MFIAAMGGVLVTMLLALVAAVRGPTVYDRILAVNMFGTKTVLLIAVAGFLAGRPEFLDLALVYALVNFIGTLGFTIAVPFMVYLVTRFGGNISKTAEFIGMERSALHRKLKSLGMRNEDRQ